MHLERQKKNAALYLFKLLLVAVNTSVFTVIWYQFYSNALMTPFYLKGNYIIVALFLVLYVSFCKLYGGFALTVNRIAETIYSQFIALLMTSLIMYAVILLLVRHLADMLPLLICLAVCMVFCALWSPAAIWLAGKAMPPCRTLLIYENPDAYSGGKIITGNMPWRFLVIDEIHAARGTKAICGKIKSDRAEAVFLCGVHSSQRNDIVKFCLESRVAAYIRPSIGDVLLDSALHIQMCNLPVLRCERAVSSVWFSFGKRLFDIVSSLFVLLLTSAFMLLTALAIKIYDGGPVFYRQLRLTRDRKAFYIYKFRSMRVDAEKDGGARLASQKDDRVTPVGRVIRRIRFDELPQLFNILKGEMTLVGPRPERPEIVALYERDMPEFSLRLQVKAGLTGFAQVYGKYNTSPYDKLEMDLMYIAKQSFVTDLKIILATIKILFMAESTEGVENAEDADFRQNEDADVDAQPPEGAVRGIQREPNGGQTSGVYK